MIKVLLLITLALLFSCKKEVIIHPASIPKSSITKDAFRVETKSITSLDSKIYDEWKNVENGKIYKEEIIFYKNQSKMKIIRDEKNQTLYTIYPEDRYTFKAINTENGDIEIWSYYISYDDDKNLVLFLRSETHDSYKLYRLKSELKPLSKFRKIFKGH